MEVLLLENAQKWVRYPNKVSPPMPDPVDDEYFQARRPPFSWKYPNEMTDFEFRNIGCFNGHERLPELPRSVHYPEDGSFPWSYHQHDLAK